MTDPNPINPFESRWDKPQNIGTDGLSQDDEGVILATLIYNALLFQRECESDVDPCLSAAAFDEWRKVHPGYTQALDQINRQVKTHIENEEDMPPFALAFLESVHQEIHTMVNGGC
jgi:hypothetical protein